MQLLILLTFSAVVVSALPSLNSSSPEWQAFKSKHRKRYRNAGEEAVRLAAFAEHKQGVDRHNKRFAQGLTTFQLGTNEYSDVPHAEFVRTMNGYKGVLTAANPSTTTTITTTTTTQKPTTTTTTTAKPISTSTTAKPTGVFVDWRTKGAVTAVKNQASCGSCWSFSSTGALEGQYFLKTGKLTPLSEQNLIDCSSIKPYANLGCSGGWMDVAFNYVIINGGIDTMASYPYKAAQGTCAYKAANIGATSSSYAFVPSGNETALMEAVRTIGPISVAIDASKSSFHGYSSGIYYEPTCSSTSLDHGVLVVGYGTDPATGLDYWIVKNSWGPSWGESGYLRMSRNRGNNCGIATEALYPIV